MQKSDREEPLEELPQEAPAEAPEDADSGTPVRPSWLAPLRRGRRGRHGPTAEQAAANQRARLHAAMFAALAEHSYQTLRARELCERSGVSSRDLYRHYKGGIHECFIDCSEAVIAEILTRVIRAWHHADQLDEQLSLAIATFTRLVAAEPTAARLVFCEPFTVGPPALRAVCEAEERLQDRLLAELGSCGAQPTPAAVRAIFAGLVDVTRARLLAGEHAELPGLAAELSAWALHCLQAPPTPTAQQLPSKTLYSGPSAVVLARASRRDAPERVRVLAATVRLVAQRGYGGLTDAAISRAARVSRKGFHEHFADKHAAFIAALEMLWATALQHAVSIARTSAARKQGPQYAIVSLVGCLAEDPLFARLALSELAAIAGEHRVQDRIRLMQLAARMLTTGHRPATATAEATAAGAWAIISHHIRHGQPDGLAEVIHTVTRLVLAPGITDATPPVRSVPRRSVSPGGESEGRAA